MQSTQLDHELNDSDNSNFQSSFNNLNSFSFDSTCHSDKNFIEEKKFQSTNYSTNHLLKQFLQQRNGKKGK